jgi:hypothetical protein
MPRTGRPLEEELVQRADISPRAHQPLRAVALRLLHVVRRTGRQAGDLLGRQRRTTLAGLPMIIDPSGNSLPSVTSEPWRPRGSAADARAVEDHGLDADQRAVADVQPCSMHWWPMVTFVAQHQFDAAVGVQHAAVLHVAVAADADAVVVAAQHAPYQTLAPSARSTRPMTVALSATQAPGATRGASSPSSIDRHGGSLQRQSR